MQHIKALLLSHQQGNLLIPANHFISLVSSKDITIVSTEMVTYNEDTFKVVFPIEGCKHCALIQSRAAHHLSMHCMPLSKQPITLELSEHELTWVNDGNSVMICQGTLQTTATVL